MTWKTMIKHVGECWMWQGCTVQGHGNYRGDMAHRVIFRELRGDFSGRMKNTCGHKSCVNPDHWSLPTEEGRFWAKVNKDGPVHPVLLTSCWLWTGASPGDRGYGTFYSRGAQVLSHRKAWEFAYGAPPDGILMHRCDTPACVLVDHLVAGSSADNIADMVSKGRHAHGESHPSARLTLDEVRVIRAKYAAGESQGKLAGIYGVSQVAISRIVTGKTWREN